MQRTRLTVHHPVGLHARPAAKFVQSASKFEAEITVANITKESAAINAKSILSVLTLGVHQGYDIEITADGPDEDEALKVLEQLVADNFGE
ncbi:MAG: HPr family phosphocarrier protein [Anaerolineales bacterium]|nr:MAG: HPr family phosphocarrier protein [Anaerolineales bacterium]